MILSVITKYFYRLTFFSLFSIFYSIDVHSACGTIPGAYPLFSTNKITLEEEFEVNGNEGDYEDSLENNKAVSITGTVSTVSLTFPDLEPTSFPNNSSSADQSFTSNTTLNTTSEIFYDKLSIDSSGIIVNFTGGGAFHINELLIDNKDITLNFETGTYYIDKLIIKGQNTQFNAGGTPVIFHIGTEFTISSSDAKINLGGNVDVFRFFLHSDAKIDSSEDNVDFIGLIYGSSNVNSVKFTGDNNAIHGAIIIAGGDIDISGVGSTLTYTTGDQTAIGNISTCISTANPTVYSLSTTDTTPVLTGTFSSSDSAGGFTVEVNSVTYTLGSSTELTNSGDDWTLDLSAISPLSIGSYDIVAAADDGAGIVLSDTTSNELTIDAVPSCVTFRDEFSTESYSRQDGTANWLTNWDEYEGTSATIPEASANPASGHIRVVNGQLILNNYSPETQNFPGVERELDLSTYNNASFTFDFVTSGNVDSSDSIVVMASANGGTNWAVLEDIRGINDTSGSKNYDLTPYISSNTKIRIRFNNETLSGLGAGCCYGASPESFSVDNIQIEACGPSSGVGDTAATAFNCVENGSNGISGKLFTKTTAQPFSFDIVALQDASTVETSFSSGADHTVTVELVNAKTTASCDSYPTLSPAVSQSISITASDLGTKASANMNSSTAYSEVKCRVTDATDSPSVIGCSTDSFSIRPSTISVSSNLTNTGSTGIPKAKTAENFTLTATTTTGYTGTPTINTSNIQAHTGAIQTGNISGTFSPANSATGIATGSTFNYSEVGSFRFTAEGIYDDSFTAVDQASDCTDDFSNTPDSAGKVGCKFGNTSTTDYFGRFTPDHFDVTLNTPIFAASCGTFTYIGQPVKYTTQPIATITAKNSAGTTTQNYTGDFWKINPTDTTYGFTPVYSINSHSLTILESSAPSYSDNGNGTGTLTFADTSNNILAISKSTLTPPFDAEITLSFNLSDTDAIVVANVNSLAQSNPVSFGTSSSGINFNNKAHRWGRAVLTNVHGSELTPLNIPVTTEYYDGTNFIANSADNCTTFTLENDFSISDTADYNCSFSSQTTPVIIGSGSIKASMSNTQLSSGSSNLILSNNSNTTLGPGAGNTGHVDITSKLDSLSWLYYDWDANSIHDNCPSARATFGIYQGNTKQIYFREVY